MSWFLDRQVAKAAETDKLALLKEKKGKMGQFVLNELLSLIYESEWDEEQLSQMLYEIARTLETHFHKGDSPIRQEQTITKLYDIAIEVSGRFKRGQRDE